MTTSGARYSVMRSRHPRRATPATARMMPAMPSSSCSLRQRVARFPRMLTHSTSGRTRCTWAARRRLEVPMRAPSGRSASVMPSLPRNASRGSWRIQYAPISKPSGSSVGRSFRLCTARSMVPSRRPSSISAVNTPFPSTSGRGVARSRSPAVSVSASSTSRPGCASIRRSRTHFACHNANSLFLVPMTRRFIANLPSTHPRGPLPLPQAPVPPHSQAPPRDRGGTAPAAWRRTHGSSRNPPWR